MMSCAAWSALHTESPFHQYRSRTVLTPSRKKLHSLRAGTVIRGIEGGGAILDHTQRLIEGWRTGGDVARDRLIARLEPDLSQIAAARLRGEGGTSLSTGDLVGEAVLRLMRIEQLDLTGRAHFLALASRLMRRILIDHARQRNSDKRRHQRVELATHIDGERTFDLESLDSALIRLGAIDAQLMDIVEMRYFGGMTVSDVAQVTGLSDATVTRRWRVARAWLAGALDGLDR